MENKYIRLIKDIGIFALGTLGSKLIIFLLLPLYTHVLSTEEYGISDLIFTLSQLILPFVSLAIFNGLLRYGLMKENRPEDALGCASRVFVFGSIAAVLLTPILKFIPSIGQWRWFLCACIVSSFAVSNALVYLKVKDKNKLYAIMSIAQTFVLVLSNIVLLVVMQLGIKGYLMAYIISNAVTALLAFVFGGMMQDLKVSKYNSTLMKAMILFSLPYVLNDVSWWAINSSNKLIIEFVLLDSAILGIFTTASKIPSLLNVVTNIFVQAWGLSSIREFDSSNDAGFYSKIFNAFIIVLVAMCIAIISVIKIFMGIYVSAEFFESWKYVPLLLIAALFSAVSGFFGSLLGAMKKSQNLMWTTLAAGVANVVVNLVFIKIFDIWGAVIGTIVAYVVVALCRLISVKRYINIKLDTLKLCLLLAVCFAQAVLVSMDVNILLTSFVAVIAFVAIVFKDVVGLYNSFVKRKGV